MANKHAFPRDREFSTIKRSWTSSIFAAIVPSKPFHPRDMGNAPWAEKKHIK